MAEDADSSISSPSPDTSSTPAPAAASETSAPSSPAAEPPAGQSGTSSESMLDAVLKVVPADNQTDALAATEEPAHPEASAEKPVEEAGEPAEDDDDISTDEAAVKGNPRLLQKKIAKLLRERHELRDTVQQMEALRPSAEIGQSVQEFATANRLGGDDVAKLLELGAMLRAGDYAGFYRSVSPFVRTAQEYLGIALPPDLSERVKAGHMTEAVAKEHARIRLENQRGQIQVREAERQQAVTSTQAVQDQVTRSVNAFEKQLAASDPDYKAKAASVRRTAQAMLLERGGRIAGVDDALSITKAAYDEVNAAMRKMRPALASTAARPNGNGTTMSATAEPKSIMEAALQGLARARNGTGHP